MQHACCSTETGTSERTQASRSGIEDKYAPAVSPATHAKSALCLLSAATGRSSSAPDSTQLQARLANVRALSGMQVYQTSKPEGGRSAEIPRIGSRSGIAKIKFDRFRQVHPMPLAAHANKGRTATRGTATRGLRALCSAFGARTGATGARASHMPLACAPTADHCGRLQARAGGSRRSWKPIDTSLLQGH